MLSPGDAPMIVRASDNQNIDRIILPLSDRKLHWNMYNYQATNENHRMSANIRMSANGFAVKLAI